jgi:hypothetical protein
MAAPGSIFSFYAGLFVVVVGVAVGLGEGHAWETMAAPDLTLFQSAGLWFVGVTE